MKTQDELFEDIKNLAIKVDGLKGWVQNDFDRMIADGVVTKEDLVDSLVDIRDDFFKARNQLADIYFEIHDLVKKTAEELK
jgi:hypothetical protein